MINRRFMIVPPALPRGGYAEKLKTRAMEFPYLLLEVANMRVFALFVRGDQLYAEPDLCRVRRHRVLGGCLRVHDLSSSPKP